MKKLIIIIIGLILVISLSAIFAWNSLPKIISHNLSKRLGVSVSISDIYLSPKWIKVKGLTIKNPLNYSKTPEALRIQTMEINTSLRHLLNKQIVIDEIELDHVFVGLEFDSSNSKRGNWTTIMNKMNQSTQKDRNGEKGKEKTTSIFIKRFVIKNLQIELAYKTGGENNRKLRPIDRIELTNISSEGGIPTAQIMNIIIQETLRNIFSKEGIQNMLEEILNPNDSKKGVIDTLKGLFSELILLDNEWECLEYTET